MARKGVISARGEVVDFDLLKIKQQIASIPKTTTVQAREDFIDQKLRRRIKRQTREVAAQVRSTSDPIVEVPETSSIVDMSTDPATSKSEPKTSRKDKNEN